MGVITRRIGDELERKVRAMVGQTNGAARGSISVIVEEAIRTWLVKDSVPMQEPRLFVAEGPNLAALSKKVSSIEIDPGDVTIEARPIPPLPEKMGLRTRAASG